MKDMMVFKSSYTRLIPFRVSQVSGTLLRGFAPRPTESRLQRWRVVGNVWEIWSAQYLNPIPPAPEANILPLVLSDFFKDTMVIHGINFHVQINSYSSVCGLWWLLHLKSLSSHFAAPFGPALSISCFIILTCAW